MFPDGNQMATNGARKGGGREFVRQTTPANGWAPGCLDAIPGASELLCLCSTFAT